MDAMAIETRPLATSQVSRDKESEARSEDQADEGRVDRFQVIDRTSSLSSEREESKLLRRGSKKAEALQENREVTT